MVETMVFQSRDRWQSLSINQCPSIPGGDNSMRKQGDRNKTRGGHQSWALEGPEWP